MRFNEFKSSAEKPGLYAVGDSHAAGVAAYDKRWINKAVAGVTSFDPSITSAIDSIPEGSTIVLSAGHNDSTGSTKKPEEIATQVSSLVNQALLKKLKIFFLLFPSGEGTKKERNEEVRMAIYGRINSKVSTVFNLNKGALSKDGIHLEPKEYKGIGEYIVPANSRLAGKVSPKIKAGPGATVNPSEVSSYLKSKGLDDNHVLGMLANIKGESGFNAGVVGDHGTSGGLFQHHADRWRNMIGYAGSDWKTDWRSQIDFALSEPAGREYVKKQFSSPQEATAWWVKYFEKPANIPAAINTRVGFLRNFA